MDGFGRRRPHWAIRWGFGLYFIGSFITWLLVGQLAGWRTGAQLGSTVAFLGVLLIFYVMLRARLGFGAFTGSLFFSSFPFGILAWSQGAHGYTWAWTTLWVAVTAIGLGFLLRVRYSLDRMANDAGY